MSTIVIFSQYVYRFFVGMNGYVMMGWVFGFVQGEVYSCLLDKKTQKEKFVCFFLYNI